VSAEEEVAVDETVLGRVTNHCSDDDGVPDVGISLGLGSGSALWLGELLKDDGGDIGFVFHGPDRVRIAAAIWPACEWREVAELLSNHVAPLLARLRDDDAKLLEALKLADATLRGANMNRNVVERKVLAAIESLAHAEKADG